MQRISLGVIPWCALMGCKWTVGWQMVRHLLMFLEWTDIQIFLAEGICLWSSANLMVKSFVLQIKQLIVPLCLLKVLTLQPSMLAFFQAFLLLFLLLFFFFYLLYNFVFPCSHCLVKRLINWNKPMMMTKLVSYVLLGV